MGLFSPSGPLQLPRVPEKSTGPRDAVPPDHARFNTNPLNPAPGKSPYATAAISSKPLSPDAPTPAVPLSSLLEEAQGDKLWGGGDDDRRTAPDAMEQELTLYRLAIDATNLNYEQAFTILALTVEFFHKGEHIERVEQHALRTAAGVILRVHKHLQDEPLRILAPFYLNQLRHIFQAWHLYRELAKAIDNRSDFIVRMRGKMDRLILESLFSEEGRSMLAARIDGFIQACTRLQIGSEPLKRAEWIGNLLMYRTDNEQWQVQAEACTGLCTRLLREIHDEALMGALRNLAVASWEGLCKETNYLRDIFAHEGGEEGHGVLLIKTAVPLVGITMRQDEAVPYFPEHAKFDQTETKKERNIRLVIP